MDTGEKTVSTKTRGHRYLQWGILRAVYLFWSFSGLAAGRFAAPPAFAA
jgi:hypothetical protein